MTRSNPTRRSVLGLIGATAAGVASTGLTLGQETLQEEVPYVLTQGDRCIDVRPLEGDQRVEEFYDYRYPTDRFDAQPASQEDTFSSHGTTHLQQEDTSILFLYHGPNGVSLVIVHGLLTEERTGGGSVSFDITGLPQSGEWVIEDDNYDAPTSYDRWDHGDRESSIDWTYLGGRNDGGVFRGLGDELRLRIEPAFNEKAALYRDYYNGEIQQWQLLSGSQEDPDRVDLALDQPVEFLRGTCGDLGGETETEAEVEQDGEADGDLAVDILPGTLVPDRPGLVPVAVEVDGFDPDALEADDVSFGPAERPGAAEPERMVVRANGTMLFLFRMQETGISAGDERATLEITVDGRVLTGTDGFRTPGGGGNSNGRGGGQSDDGNGRGQGGGDDEDDEDGGNIDDILDDDESRGGPPDDPGAPDHAWPNGD
jgi:hypothetical protein